MKAENLLISAFLACLLGCFSCKKKQEITYRIDYVNGNLFSEYFSRPGSYWVYEDQNVQTDSIAVISMDYGLNTFPCTQGCPGGIVHKDQFYVMNLRNVTQNKNYNYYFLGNHIKQNGGGEYGQLGQPVFVYNGKPGDEFNGVTVVEKLDSLTILGNTYYQVTKMRISAADQCQHEFNLDTELYFAKNVGLIKKEVIDAVNGNQVFQLKRFHRE